MNQQEKYRPSNPFYRAETVFEFKEELGGYDDAAILEGEKTALYQTFPDPVFLTGTQIEIDERIEEEFGPIAAGIFKYLYSFCDDKELGFIKSLCETIIAQGRPK